ncbi:MAG: hypothetical protein ABMB14_01400 [Myxococcota bacterium]
MDAVSAIGCLLVGSSLPVVASFLLARRGMRQLQVATTYGDVARELGLDVDTRGVSLQGHLGEQRLWVGEVMVGHGPDRRMACWGVLDLERPLGLGLLLRRRGLSQRLFRRPRGVRIPAVDAELDRLVEIHGDDPELVHRLLDDAVREHLGLLLTRWRDLVVTDQSIRVYLSQPLARTAELRELVDGMRALASALAGARRALPPPVALRAATHGWAALADRLGLGLEDAFPGIAGSSDGRSIRVTPVRTADGYGAELRLGFRPHRRTGLRLRPQVEPDGYWSVGQDIQLGDDGFDAAFVVKGDDPEGVRELLSPPVRAGLVTLGSAGRLDVDDLRLYVGGLPIDPTALGPIVTEAIRTAAGMGW